MEAIFSTSGNFGRGNNLFHVTERMFIRQIGKILGFSDTELEDAMAVGI